MAKGQKRSNKEVKKPKQVEAQGRQRGLEPDRAARARRPPRAARPEQRRVSGRGSGMDWSAARYTRFEDERTRPARDLVDRIPTRAAARTVDLGCGPGNSDRAPRRALPRAPSTLGIDSSRRHARRPPAPGCPRPLRRGPTSPPGRPRTPFDVILANASLQWVPDHETLFPALSARLAPGGSLAVQMPDNLDEPTHRLMRETAAHPDWRDRLSGAAAARAARHDAGWYFRLLKPRARTGRRLAHQLPPPARRPRRRGRLADAAPACARSSPRSAPAEAEAFLARYRDAVAEAYPTLEDGTLLLPFPRLFLIATR